MKIDKIRIEKIKAWNKHKQKVKHKNYKKGMETNETRKGKYSKIIFFKLQKIRNQIKSRK
jgi:hypothetical protein